MNTAIFHHPYPEKGFGRTGGFTLIELMIAMLLGLIVIAGVSSVFLANLRAYKTTTAIGNVEDSSRIAFELMARDIRQAGLTGCNSANGRIVNVLNKQDTNWWANWNNAVRGYDNATDDPALTALASVANTSSLELISAGGSPVTLANDDPGTNFKLNKLTTTVGKGDVVMACSPDHAAIVQITGQNDSNVTIGYNGGNSVTPGNCSTNLGYPNDNCTGNSPDYAFPANSQISKLTAVDWYIGTNNAGGKSLYRATLINSGGDMTVSPQEMVRNVTNMTITYLNPGNSAIANTYQTAATISADGAWKGVTAVQVTLKLQSNSTRANVDGTGAIERTYSFTTALRNRLN